MLMQTITMNEQAVRRLPSEQRLDPEAHFPGLGTGVGQRDPAAPWCAPRACRCTTWRTSACTTRARWPSGGERFLERREDRAALGFDERFLRMWDYYLAYCEGGFRERYISDVQLLLTKCASPRTLFGEPAPAASAIRVTTTA